MSRALILRLLIGVSVVWGAWAVWTIQGRSQPFAMVVIDDLGQPIAGAEIGWRDRVLAETDTDGRAELQWERGLEGLSINATGFQGTSLPLLSPPTGDLEAVLRASFLRGRIVDAENRPLEGAYVTTGSQTAVSDGEGRFAVRNAEPGTVQVWRPAWEGSSFDWDGQSGQERFVIAPEMLKAVHIGGEAAQKSWPSFLRLVERTELNAVMLDLKDETGAVFFDASNEAARMIGAVDVRYDLGELVGSAHQANAYAIGRIVAFQDPIAAHGAPDWAVWDTAINAPYAHNGQFFLDPTDPGAQAYALELAAEACEAGLDEIQFDYVRFPDGLRDGARFDGGASAEVRVATIRDFLGTAVAALHPLGCAVGADIFGFITSAVDDGGIGQQWEEVTKVVDVASPMLYPSHYSSGWYGYQVPSDHPGPLVGEALDDALTRVAREIVVRPWLQDFAYTEDQVRAQIDEAEARGLGWMLWNAASEVSVGALRP
ncbi:MAG TPA: putative glycoside hydrolase [Acidimicrobiia bacterium]|nr:putative glycoside hydrolase [Acidimicrobiia bacterium]